MEPIFHNSEVVTLDEQIQPRHKLGEIIALALVTTFILALAIPPAQAPLPTAGSKARAALCGTVQP